MEIGAVDNGEERPVADLPQGHVEWLVRMQARQASSGNNTPEGQTSPSFLRLTAQALLGDGAPLAVRETDQEILRRRGVDPLEGSPSRLVAVEHGLRRRLHSFLDAQRRLFALLFHGREVQALLAGHHIEEARALVPPGNQVGDRV